MLYTYISLELIYLSMYLYLSIYLLISLSIYLSIYLSTYLSIYPYTYTHGAFVNLGKNSRHYHNSNLDYKINNIGLPLMILKRQQLLQHFNFGFNIKITSTCYLSNLILVHLHKYFEFNMPIEHLNHIDLLYITKGGWNKPHKKLRLSSLTHLK